LLVGTHELGWDGIYGPVHDIEKSIADSGGLGGVLAWIFNTSVSAVIGLIVGFVVVAIVSRLHAKSHDGHDTSTLGEAATGAH
jgi:predicted DNA repair protein MutK